MALNNNDIFKKLRVALQLRDDEIVKICSLVNFKVTTTELGAFFRSEDHPKYVECGDQILRNFLNGLVIHMRGPAPDKEKKAPTEKNSVVVNPKNSVESTNKSRRIDAIKDKPSNEKSAVKIGDKVFKRRDI